MSRNAWLELGAWLGVRGAEQGWRARPDQRATHRGVDLSDGSQQTMSFAAVDAEYLRHLHCALARVRNAAPEVVVLLARQPRIFAVAPQLEEPAAPEQCHRVDVVLP